MLDFSILTDFILQEDDEDGSDINFICSNEFKLRECKLEIKNGAAESSSIRTVIPQTGSSITGVSTSQAQDGVRSLPVFSQSKVFYFKILTKTLHILLIMFCLVTLMLLSFLSGP